MSCEQGGDDGVHTFHMLDALWLRETGVAFDVSSAITLLRSRAAPLVPVVCSISRTLRQVIGYQDPSSITGKHLATSHNVSKAR